MNNNELQTALKHLPLGGLRYYDKVGSTNDIALNWANQKDIKDYSLVLANEQKSGRGRNGRRWQTPPDSALALSLILLPNNEEKKNLVLFTALGALALTKTLATLYDLPAQIKWPNDILLSGKKVAGILAEVSWLGDQPIAIVLGIGINTGTKSVPPDNEITFPATSLEDMTGKSINRLTLLSALLKSIMGWRQYLGNAEMVAAWDAHLAYKGKQVQIQARDGQVIHGKVLGINPDGSLRLDTAASIHFGDVHLRPSRV